MITALTLTATGVLVIAAIREARSRRRLDADMDQAIANVTRPAVLLWAAEAERLRAEMESGELTPREAAWLLFQAADGDFAKLWQAAMVISGWRDAVQAPGRTP